MVDEIHFNPRPRKEGDLTIPGSSFAISDFNPRPRKEGDEEFEKRQQALRISIHALVKRATKCYDLCCGFDIISIHALVKRATGWGAAVKRQPPNFNPRPRKEGDKKLVGDLDYTIISIHALVKRATGFEMSFLLPYLISIHALVKRATPCLCENCVIVLYFNPRPRKEGDHITGKALQ